MAVSASSSSSSLQAEASSVSLFALELDESWTPDPLVAVLLVRRWWCAVVCLLLFLTVESGGPSSVRRSCCVVSLRTIQKDDVSPRLTSSILPLSNTFARSTSAGTPSFLACGTGARTKSAAMSAVKMLLRAMGHDSPSKIAMDTAAPQAFDDRSEMLFAQSFWEKFAGACKGNQNEIPGHEMQYLPFSPSLPKNSPGVVGPNFVYMCLKGGPASEG
jgi:hypothetical protein